MNQIEQVDNLAQEIYGSTAELLAEGNKPFAISAIYIMIALQIYKTMLSDEEFNSMVDMISSSRDEVKKLSDLDTIFFSSDSVH